MLRPSLRQRSTRPRALLLSTVFLSALVTSPSQGQDCDSNASLSVGNASAPPGEVAVELRGGSLCDVTGLSLAVGHDVRRVEFFRAELSPFLKSHPGGRPFFFARGRNDEGYMTLFVAFNFSAPPAPIPEDSLLATLFYRTKPGVRPGRILLRNENRAFGRPPIANIFTTRGSAIDPQLQDGSITILDCATGASLSLGNAAAPAGEVSVELRGGSVCTVTGLRLAIGHDAERVEFLRAEPGPLLESHAGSDLVFLAEGNNSEGFMTLRVALDESEPVTVPSISIPENSVLAVLFYGIKPAARPGEIIVLRNEAKAFGDPPIANVFTTEEAVLEPELHDGSITITEIIEAVSEFRRGDADADGDLDFTDAVTMITYRTPGGPELPCFKAADADDDGRVNLTDALYLLNFLFGSGPEPPAPFTECGLDETTDLLSCKSFPACL